MDEVKTEQNELTAKTEAKLTAALKREEKSLAGFFIKNYRFTYLIMAAILLLGGFAILAMPREADPEVKIPFAVVSTVFPGGSPVDVEELVTNKIEEKVKNLDDLRQYTSSSGQSVSSIFVEFAAEADLQASYQKLRDAVDEAKSGLPPEAEDPVVTEIRVNDFPIVVYSLVCAPATPAAVCSLEEYAESIQSELEGIAGVSKAEIVGEEEREFQVIVDQARLVNYGLSLGQVIGAIARANFNLPAGRITIDGYEYGVRVQGKLPAAEALQDVVVATYDNTPVYLRDVAKIVDGYKEQETKARIGFFNEPSQPTISLQVYKKTGGNIINIVAAADQKIADLSVSRLPAAVKAVKTSDNSYYIKDSLNTLGFSGVQTMVLIFALLYLVLGWRGALITGLSVPIAFLMGFVFLYARGETLNSIVLYSLVISLGIMVDNSIIIMEGINEYVTKFRKSPLEAALLSVWNFKWPITAGTLTTVAAFLPMLLVSGILGEYLSFIPITISATLLSSLFVALVIVPMLSTRAIRVHNNGQTGVRPAANGGLKRLGGQYERCAGIVNRVKCRYEKLMRNIMASRARRRTIIISAWAVFCLAVLVPLTGLMKIQMFPPVDFETIYVTVEMPANTAQAKTDEVVKEAERIVAQLPEIKSYVTSLGTKLSFQGEGGRGPNLSTITANLKPAAERNRRSAAIAAELRGKLAALSSGRLSVDEVSAGPPTGAPIEVRIYGPDNAVLAQLADGVEKILAGQPEVINIESSVAESTGEFTYTIDRAQANYYGLDITAVAAHLRNAVYGAKASAVTLDGRDIDITVKYDERYFSDANALGGLLLATPRGEYIPLNKIASFSLEPALEAINHRDGERLVTVTADLAAGGDLPAVLAAFNEAAGSLKQPEDYRVVVGGELEDIAQSYRETFLSMIVAVIMIAFILVLQFNSFRQPFIILSTLPLAIIGVIAGLNLLRMPFSFPVFLGIVALAGVAVNDAIVLIDRINKNLELGMDRIEGIIEGGVARLQPIFLTSVTTIAGIFPLIFADEIWRGFSIALIFGLISSTILTLVVVPILYNAITHKDRFTAKYRE
ncbi:MAG: efflux RND transporter permease subunit [Planctomycetes bacterium]|jgi:multidrug efflux pump subunit AcrB|nr:efflux RND transporter permease subunit [Planctomycetota bacterium]